jgi:hypothetical protein
MLFNLAVASVSLSAKPSQPTWPLEFSAYVAKEDLTTNKTEGWQMSWSASQNCTLNDFRVSSSAVDILNVFSFHTAFTVVTAPPAPEKCTAAPLPGNMDPPRVQDFVFQGQQPFPPDSNNMVWIWKGGDLIYGTQQTEKQEPAVLLDGATKIVYGFANVQYFTPESWPATYWQLPPSCRG